MVCKSCAQDKAFSEFYKSKNTKSGYRGKCISCTKIDNSNWYDKNKEKLKPVRKAYQQSHREDAARRTREYRARNEEKSRDRSHQNYMNNRDKVLARSKENHTKKPGYSGWKGSRRRARLKKNGGSFSYKELKELYSKYNSQCINPECVTPNEILTPDHIIPLIKGGSNNIDNIQPLCLRCNLRKGQKTIDYREKYV